MNQDYKIHRWDSVIISTNKKCLTPTPIASKPMLYIKPDNTLLQFAKDNNNELLVDVEYGTRFPNIKRRVKGQFYKSSEIYKRPNFFNTTGLYIIVLDTDWDGYPDTLGVVNIFGYKGGIPETELVKDKKTNKKTKNIENTKLLEKYIYDTDNNTKKNKSSCGGNSTKDCVSCIVMVIIVIIGVFLIIKN